MVPVPTHTPKPVIAIDGPTASGKGTLARRLADHFGFAWLDTGGLYRLVAQRLMASGAALSDENAAENCARGLSAEQMMHQVHDAALRDALMSQPSSIVASYAGVRAALVDLQRAFACAPPDRAEGVPALGAVLDGRDIGTVICPDAALKFYVTADPAVRARRRFLELQSRGNSVTYEAVLEDIHRRDARDQGRAVAPLRIADDALVIDTTQRSADDVLADIVRMTRERLGLTPFEGGIWNTG